MAVRRFAFTLCVAGVINATVAHSQSMAVELSQNAGYSTENVAAVATQLRAFGEVASGIRFTAEGAWAARSAADSDVFGAAYPYTNRIQVIEAYGERTFQPQGGIVGIRFGRYRTPFGISSSSDHAYVGFLRSPLIRYDGYFALSNNFLEHGADVIVGTPRLSLEASLGAPADVGTANRRAGLDTVLRGQAAVGSVIVGVSHILTRPYQPLTFARGRAAFTGVDVRWMRDGVQARGEWIAGRPFDGTTTTGGYADLIIHRPRMGPVTAVARVDRLAYDAVPPFALFAERYTAGARIRVLDRLAVQVELLHQSRALPQRRATAIDLGLTYSVRRN
jgi:hypothetical protein